MAEPPAKRSRRVDSSAMWERDAAETRPRDYADRSTPDDASKRKGRKRTRSPSRERGDTTRDRPARNDRNYESRDGRPKPARPRERSTSRERHGARRGGLRSCALHDADTNRDLGDDRARSRSPRRDDQRNKGHRARSPPRGARNERSRERPRAGGNRPRETNGSAKGPAPSKRATDRRDADEMEGVEEDEETQMMRMMGFGNFKTTKNTKVPGNERNYAVRKEKTTEYRQYMNRQGGFNRPLSPG